jgi:hypothetical protein
MYQFTPPAEVRFAFPDSASRLEFVETMRAGSYDGAGHSDGVGVTLLVARNKGESEKAFEEYLNPRDRPEDRGVLARSIPIPPGANRIVILRVDQGPAHDGRWDWPLFAEMRAR